MLLSNKQTCSYGFDLIASAAVSNLRLHNFSLKTCKLWNILPKKVLLMSSLPKFKS